MYKAIGIDHTAGLMIPKNLSALRVKKPFRRQRCAFLTWGFSYRQNDGDVSEQLRERYIQTKKCTGKDVNFYRTFAEDPGTWPIYDIYEAPSPTEASRQYKEWDVALDQELRSTFGPLLTSF